MLALIIRLFPLWAVLFSAYAYLNPSHFVSLQNLIVPCLTLIMLTMGLTLTPAHFKNVLRHKSAVALGVCLQFSVMPLAALLVSRMLGFDHELTLGMILVGAVAGGTASNVLCYLAKGDVALSISMTACSTLVGVVVTPVLIELLAGARVDVPASAMLLSLIKIVLIPVIIGVLMNHYLKRITQALEPVLPLISMLLIVFIIGVIMAVNAQQIASVGVLVIVAVILHNSLGLCLGYGAAKLLGFDEKVCRTVCFEVGLQNSGLAVALAMKFFTPITAVAGSLFSIWHNISGSILAGIWSKQVKANVAE